MRHLTTMIGVLLASCSASSPVLAQLTFPTQAPGVRVGGMVVMKCDPGGPNGVTNCRPVTSTDALPVSGGTGGGGGGGDASATNQSTQIAAEQAIRDRIGDTSSPATGTVNSRLGSILSALGSPFQAGGSIGNTAFGISGTLPAFAATPTFNLGTLNGAATAANQSTQITAEQAIQSTSATLAATVGTRGSSAPTTAQTVQGVDANGTGRAVLLGTDGSLGAPSVGTAARIITKTSVAANTSTTICPASTPAVAATEIQVGARTGLGLNGQTLSQVERGTAAASPDMMLPAADTLYAMPIGATNVITGYSATAFIALCVQTLRP